MKKLGYIDALRGFAILAVLMVHCVGFGTNNYPSLIQSIVGNGGRGVQLFYVISAFTLFLSMNNRVGEEQNAKSNFFIRRFFRIAPMFYIAIIYFVFERLFYGNIQSETPLDLTIGAVAATATFLHGFSPYWINNVVPGGWSIATEMMFYCLVPFLFRKVKNLNHALIAFFVAIFLQHSIIFVIKQIPFADAELMKGYLYYFLPNNLPVFACGILLFYLVYTPKKDWTVAPFTIIFAGICLLFQIATERLLFSLHVQFAIAFVVIAYGLSKKEISLFVNPVTRYIGKISYSMYLVHFAVLHCMSRLNFLDFVPLNIKYGNMFNLGIRYTIVFVITVAISTVCYRWVEVPFQNLGKRLIKRRQKSIN